MRAAQAGLGSSCRSRNDSPHHCGLNGAERLGQPALPSLPSAPRDDLFLASETDALKPRSCCRTPHNIFPHLGLAAAAHTPRTRAMAAMLSSRRTPQYLLVGLAVLACGALLVSSSFPSDTLLEVRIAAAHRQCHRMAALALPSALPGAIVARTHKNCAAPVVPCCRLDPCRVGCQRSMSAPSGQ